MALPCHNKGPPLVQTNLTWLCVDSDRLGFGLTQLDLSFVQLRST